MPLSLTFFRNRRIKLSGDSSGRNSTFAIPSHLPCSHKSYTPNNNVLTKKKLGPCYREEMTGAPSAGESILKRGLFAKFQRKLE
jgi:hypothetical protein